MQPLSLDKFGDPLHTFNAITPSVCNLQPSSRGHVRVKSADPLDAPAITLNYLSASEDQDIAVAGLRFTRRIMAAKALRRFEPEEWKPGPDVESDDARQLTGVGIDSITPRHQRMPIDLQQAAFTTGC